MDFKPGIVVGLTAEARIARRLGLPVEIGGGTATGAEAAAHRLVAAGVTGLISFGLCGGLQPHLKAGRLLVPTEILFENGETFVTNRELSLWLGGATPHIILAGSQILAQAREKRRNWKITGAAAVDLESAAVVRVAVEHGLPFACLRAVCDTAERDLPRAAVMALDPSGEIQTGAVAWSVLTHPWQIPALIGLSREAAAARRGLLRRVREIIKAQR